MKAVYRVSVFLYNLIIKLISPFNSKARQRTTGIKETFKQKIPEKKSLRIWFHCASSGEFEQALPLIEKIKSKNPEYEIILSFFSPSGYETKKNCKHAEVVFYLPPDNPKNAKQLITYFKPDTAFFVKYEFWYYFLNELKRQNIPVYLISGIFRKNQIFFKPYGKFFREILHLFSRLFVQNKESEQLLNSAGINNVSVTGDTRFDRVTEIAEKRKKFETVDKFTENAVVFVAGSTWKPDEEIIFSYLNKLPGKKVKVIIAPHEIKKENTDFIIKISNKKTVRYSEAVNNLPDDAEILIIDNIGMLSSLYAYADIAYIGGGFGAGIHNTLEAAVFGVPVIFGKKFEKFEEAKALIRKKAAFPVYGKSDFEEIFDTLLQNEEFRKQAGKNAEKFVQENLGASDKILKKINL
ncbi:MAG: 3-deoxy-D-manno-octulosonic acid transferase [Chlorobi bacterium]|nr:3-deoxy-D-manno-octulosonic acid transferase [Chlorobiota bacterium]